MSEKDKKGGSATVAPAMGPPALINKEDIPQVLPILPLRNSVFFPGGVLPLAVGRQKTIALIKDAVRDEQVIGVVTQRRAEEEDPGAADLYTVGTVARIVKLLKKGEDNYLLVVQGLARVRVLDLVQESPYLKARVEPVEDKTAVDEVEVEALAINLKKLAREVIELMPELPAAASELVESITHPGHLADLIAANVDVPIEEKQQGLETVDLKARMKLVLKLLNRKREILKLSNKIDSAVKGEMSKTQREYYLRQQLKAIKEELGELGEEEEELDELAERPLGDVNESNAVKLAFGEHAKKMVVNSTKSMTGHLLGGAGGVESVFTVLAVHHQLSPPTINIFNQDPECDLDYCANTARDMRNDVALTNSFGFGGTNGTLVFRRA